MMECGWKASDCYLFCLDIDGNVDVDLSSPAN